MTRRLTREEMDLWERLHARRLGMGPYYAGALVFCVGHIAWPLFAEVEVRIGLGLIVALALMWIFTRLHGGLHIGYALTCLAASVVWVYQLFFIQNFYPDYLEAVFWWLLGVHGLGMGWWSSKLKRTEVHLEDDLRGWQEVAKNFGLGMTTRHIVKRDENGNESGFLVWPRGSAKVSSVMDKREELEGAMGLPEGSLRLMKHRQGARAATDRVDYVSFSDDPLTESIEWSGPQQAKDGGDLSVDAPCLVGLQEDKKEAYVPYYDREINAVVNKLFGGSQGSGKSGAVNLHILDVACRSDGTQWGIDMKDGMEIAPLDRIMDNLACNHDELTEMIDALDAIMTYRGEENTRCGRKAWPVSPENPLLFVWMDELHRVMGANGSRSPSTMRRCEEVMVRIATTGRALGMSTNGATQNPTLEATRTSQFRDRLNQRICFRTESSSHEGYIIPGRKVDAHLIPSAQPGTCYVQDRDNWTGMPVRYFFVTDEMIEMVLNIRAPGLPLDEGSRRAACAVSPRYAARCAERYGDDFDGDGGVGDDGPDGSRPDGGGATVTHIDPEPLPQYPSIHDLPDISLKDIHRARQGSVAVLESPHELEQEPLVAALEARVRPLKERKAALPVGEEAVMAVLQGRGRAGAGVRELCDVAERRKAWFYSNAKRWVAEGLVVQPDGQGGNYVLAEYVRD